MSLIRSLIGRRQFLIASMASTSTLAYKKIANAFAPGVSSAAPIASGFSARNANASEATGSANAGGASGKYSHLLSPLKVRNVILKNRMFYTVSIPHYLQGPEIFPPDTVRSYYARIAKTAAIVTCRIQGDRGMPRNIRKGDSAHMPIWDIENPAVQNYIDQLVEGVHCYGSLVSSGGLGGGSIEDTVIQAKKLEDQGIDVVGMGVRNLQDQKAVRSAIEQMQAVKNATGLLIMISTQVIEPTVRPETSGMGSGIILEEAIELAKTFEDAADILFFKANGSMTNHPTGFNQEEGHPVVLQIAQAIKESGTKIIVAPNGGFRDPDRSDAYIADGKTDMIAMARAFICDPQYGQKVYEGRGEDTVPCIMCNKCHGLSMKKSWYSVCSVNPQLGISSAVRVIDPPNESQRVAVIGGGPAGMKAAITAAERGHAVTLFEQSDSLGGLLKHADFSPFKWPLRNFKNYLIRQTYKAGVDVLLNTQATPDMIKAKGFDVVFAAVGAEPNIPRMPGADDENVYDIVNVYGQQNLGGNIVFIGGGEFGVETGIYLAEAGHKVMMLTSAKELFRNERVHFPEQIIDTYEHLENFDFLTEVTVTGISKKNVTYVDAGGQRQSIRADSVVIYAGLKPKQNEALTFCGSAGKTFFAVGDCTGKGGNVQKSIRNAFFTASQI